jgi:chromosomal replication initiation ATPase DnaA
MTFARSFDVAEPRILPIAHIAAIRNRDNRMFIMAAWIAHKNGLTVDHFKAHDRHRPVAWPRQEFMLAAHEAGYSMPEIGRFLNRDHTTILHGIRQARARRGA